MVWLQVGWGGLASRWGSANLERGGKEKPAHGSGKQGWTQPHVKQLCLYFQNWRDLKVMSLQRGDIETQTHPGLPHRHSSSQARGLTADRKA